jgi:hypothetical protein
MISRSNMRRQLRASGGITNARQGYGVGSWVKERIRKIIPNELADVAVKAAPFVAPFFPGIAAGMRGIGRFDQRGSISDAMKQAAGTYAFGKGARYLGGVDASLMPGQGTVGNQYSMANLRGGPLGNFVPGKKGPGKLADVRQTPSGAPGGGDKTMFSNKSAVNKAIDTSAAKTPGFMKTATEATIGKIPGLRALPELVQQQLLVGGVTAGAEALYNYLAGGVEQEEGESVDEYMARRKIVVGKQMRTYMDSYYTPLTNPEYAAKSDKEKDAFVARYNVNQGGLMRQNYQTGGISMLNTTAQNRAINNARQAAVNTELEAPRNRIRQKMSQLGQALNPSGNTVLQRMQNAQNAPSASETLGNLYNKQGIAEAENKYIDQVLASTPTYKEKINKVDDLMSGSGFVSDLRHKTAAAQLRDSLGGGIMGNIAANVGGALREIPQLLTGDFKGVGEDLKANYGGKDIPVGLTPQESYDYLIAQQQVDPGVVVDQPSAMPQGSPGQLNPVPPGEQDYFPVYDGELGRYLTEEEYTNRSLKQIAERDNPTPTPDASGYNFDSEYYRNNPDPFTKDYDRFTAAYAKATGGGKTTVSSDGQVSTSFGNYDPGNTYGYYTRNQNQAGPDHGDFYSMFGDDDKIKMKSIMESMYGAPGMLDPRDRPGYTNTGFTPALMASGGRVGQNMGGIMRAGYAMGTPLPNDPTKPINPFGPKPTGPVLPSNNKMADATISPLMGRIMELMMNEKLTYGKAKEQAESEQRQQPYIDERMGMGPGPILEAANGGLMRLNYMIGGEAKQMEAGAPPIMYSGNMDPNAQAGLPSTPGPIQMAEDGPEFDMREEGGFQPLGRQEGKDDVPAMLAKNEFVMTADAVRAAGGGSIQKGAQKMYDTMKKLESRVS